MNIRKSVLVIGGTGFIGKYLVEELINHKYEVTVLCRKKVDSWNMQSVKFLFGDIKDSSIVEKATLEKDVVFHLAAKADIWGSYRLYYQTNVVGTQNILKACIKNEVPKLVYTSTPSVVLSKKSVKNADETIPKPKRYLNNYQRTKSIAEQLVIEANSPTLQTVAIRPQAVWGDGDRHIFTRVLKKMKKKKLRIIGSGKNEMSVSYVNNVAWAHFLAGQADHIGGNVYFINDENPVNPWEWISENTKHLNYRIPKGKIPKTIALFVSGMLEFIYSLFHIKTEPPFTRFTVRQLSQDHSYTIKKAKKDFGYYEKYDLEEGKRKFRKYLSKINEQEDF